MRERCEKCGQTLNPWRVRVKSKLTARQWEYIECFISGLSRKQTAEKLFVCEKAVAWQVTAIGKALGVKGKREIALRALEILDSKK